MFSDKVTAQEFAVRVLKGHLEATEKPVYWLRPIPPSSSKLVHMTHEEGEHGIWLLIERPDLWEGRFAFVAISLDSLSVVRELIGQPLHKGE